MVNDLFLNNTKASLPMICPTPTGPLMVGGVLGNVNANSQITIAVINDI